MSNRLFNMTVGTETGLYCRREWERPCCSTRIFSHLTRGHQEHCSSNQWLFWYYAVVCMVNSHPWLFSAIGEVEQKLGTKQVNFLEYPTVVKQLSPLEPTPWTTMISCHLFNCPYLCWIYSWPLLPCLKSTRIPRVFNFLVTSFFKSVRTLQNAVKLLWIQHTIRHLFYYPISLY